MRKWVVLGVSIGVVGLLAPAAAPSAAGTARVAAPVSLAPLEAALVQQTNAIRRQHGVAPVKLNDNLAGAASAHSDEMATDGYFDHTSPDGTSFWKRIGRWYSSRGYSFWSVGENILWSAPQASAPSAMRLWMASPPHRANILNPAWREIGISAVHVGRGPGVYGGRPATIITADFGARR